ncbi:MAG TPA: prolyl oligopeptidase family serine peptidase [Candidatus Limnocylindrales bacterium]
MSNHPRWERRFRAPILAFPAWAADAPDRMVLASTESGSYQLHAWDRATGRKRQVTRDRVGVLEGRPTRDGTGVIWFRDETGAETGTFVVAPFDEDAVPEPLLEGLPKGWSEGLAIGRHRSLAAVSTEEGYTVWVSDDGGPVRLLHEHAQPVRLAGGWGLSGSVDRGALSADDRVVVLEVMEDGDVLHPSLKAMDASTGETLGLLRDAGLELAGFGFSPLAGDLRMAITHERTGERRPAIWDIATGEVRELVLDLEGAVEPADWWPDASALLLLQLEAGRHRLHRYDLATGEVTAFATEPGSITAAAVRPDGAVWYRGHNGQHPALLLEVGTAAPLLAAEGPPAPAGRDFEAWWFTNPKGQRVHGFLVHPEGTGPHPVMMRVHGGPHSLDMDRWAPDVQAHVDAGFLVAMVNYRGSEGFGQAWRDELTGNIGFLELEDVLAGLDDLVGRGLADPSQAVLAGWSWGGYVTLLGLGRHPERWVAGIGGVPVADYVAAYEDEAPILQALDRALFGGSPDEVPGLFAERSPITYVDAVSAPLLILAGENDSRCPIRQVWNYVGRLRARGQDPQVYTYATGHASFDVDERIRQTAIVLDFLARSVPGVARLDGLDAHLATAGAAG